MVALFGRRVVRSHCRQGDEPFCEFAIDKDILYWMDTHSAYIDRDPTPGVHFPFRPFFFRLNINDFFFHYECFRSYAFVSDLLLERELFVDIRSLFRRTGPLVGILYL